MPVITPTAPVFPREISGAGGRGVAEAAGGGEDGWDWTPIVPAPANNSARQNRAMTLNRMGIPLVGRHDVRCVFSKRMITFFATPGYCKNTLAMTWRSKLSCSFT